MWLPRFVLGIAISLSLFGQIKPDKECPNTHAVEIPLEFAWLGNNCVQFNGGFDGVAGSFVGLALSTRNRLHLGEILRLDAQLGVRQRGLVFGFEKPTLSGKRIETGFTVYGRRFRYHQARESSIFAFQRDIPEFERSRRTT